MVIPPPPASGRGKKSEQIYLPDFWGGNGEVVAIGLWLLAIGIPPPEILRIKNPWISCLPRKQGRGCFKFTPLTG